MAHNRHRSRKNSSGHAKQAGQARDAVHLQHPTRIYETRSRPGPRAPNVRVEVVLTRRKLDAKRRGRTSNGVRPLFPQACWSPVHGPGSRPACRGRSRPCKSWHDRQSHERADRHRAREQSSRVFGSRRNGSHVRGSPTVTRVTVREKMTSGVPGDRRRRHPTRVRLPNPVTNPPLGRSRALCLNAAQLFADSPSAESYEPPKNSGTITRQLSPNSSPTFGRLHRRPLRPPFPEDR